VYGTSDSGIGVQGYVGSTGADGLPSSAGVLGVDNTSDGTYGVYGWSNNGHGVHGNAALIGVYGTADLGTGVYGTGLYYGVQGNSGYYGVSGNSDSGIGVQGYVGSTGADGLPSSAGVLGVDNTSDGTYGVYGTSAAGTGVYGTVSGDTTGQTALEGNDQTTGSGGGYGVIGSSVNGTGVRAVSSAGTALAVDGVVTFARSGIAKVAGTSTKAAQTVTVKGVALTSSSLILVTPQGIVAGVAVEGVVPDVSGSSFVIHLTQAIDVSLKIAWFVIG
jgi:hypothetical protein